MLWFPEPEFPEMLRFSEKLGFPEMPEFPEMLKFSRMLGTRARYKSKGQDISFRNAKKDFYKSDANVTLSKNGNAILKQLEKLKVTLRIKSKNINCILT